MVQHSLYGFIFWYFSKIYFFLVLNIMLKKLFDYYCLITFPSIPKRQLKMRFLWIPCYVTVAFRFTIKMLISMTNMHANNETRSEPVGSVVEDSQRFIYAYLLQVSIIVYLRSIFYPLHWFAGIKSKPMTVYQEYHRSFLSRRWNVFILVFVILFMLDIEQNSFLPVNSFNSMCILCMYCLNKDARSYISKHSLMMLMLSSICTRHQMKQSTSNSKINLLFIPNVYVNRSLTHKIQTLFDTNYTFYVYFVYLCCM